MITNSPEDSMMVSYAEVSGGKLLGRICIFKALVCAAAVYDVLRKNR